MQLSTRCESFEVEERLKLQLRLLNHMVWEFVFELISMCLFDTRKTAYSLFLNNFTKGSGVLCHSWGHKGSFPRFLRLGSSWSQTSVKAHPFLSTDKHHPAWRIKYSTFKLARFLWIGAFGKKTSLLLNNF